MSEEFLAVSNPDFAALVRAPFDGDVRAAIARDLATLDRVQVVPAPPFGFGADLWCEADLRADFAEVDGKTTLALAQAIVRRLDCPRGALPDDPDYGLDLRGYCNRGVTADEIRSLAGRIRSEVAKDDRIEALGVTVTPSPTGTELDVTLAVTARDPALGGFSLTLALTSADVLIEEIRRTA
jgi:hypothetical protein